MKFGRKGKLHDGDGSIEIILCFFRLFRYRKEMVAETVSFMYVFIFLNSVLHSPPGVVLHESNKHCDHYQSCGFKPFQPKPEPKRKGFASSSLFIASYI